MHLYATVDMRNSGHRLEIDVQPSPTFWVINKINESRHTFEHSRDSDVNDTTFSPNNIKEAKFASSGA